MCTQAHPYTPLVLQLKKKKQEGDVEKASAEKGAPKFAAAKREREKTQKRKLIESGNKVCGSILTD